MIAFRSLGLLFAALVAMCGPSRAQGPVEAFYRGKTITLMVGAAPGAAYDLVGRAVVAHMSRHIPGEPAIVVQNMPGAASLVMVNQLANRAPRDGTAMGLAINSILVEPKLKVYAGAGSNVQFDLARLGWIGSPAEQPLVLSVWHTSQIRTFADLKTRNMTLGATSPSADGYVLPTLLNRLLGTRITLVTGYKGISEIFVAAERGEVEGNATPLSSLATARPDDLAQGKFRVLAQFGTERVKALPDVPTGIEQAKDDATARRVLAFYALKFKATFPMLVPPDVPADRLAALQNAFDATMQDPRFLEQARRSNIDVSPIGGREMGRLIAEIEAADEGTVEIMRKAMSN